MWGVLSGRINQAGLTATVAKFLLVWELGGALGHLATLRALATPLVERGHEVSLVLRDLKHAPQFFPDLECVSAPISAEIGPHAIAEPSTFADVLYISGWNDERKLGALVGQWQSLFHKAEPDLVVCNYAPTAVLALQSETARVVLFGTGFCCPPDLSPFPDLCPWRDNYPERLQFTERQVLRALNKQLASQAVAEVERVSELFGRADANLLTTLPEMDHYSNREGGEYVGPWGELSGTAPDWPQGSGRRVFAYLKPMEALPYLLAELRRLELPSLVYAPSATETAEAFESERLRIVNAPLDMRRTSKECDLAILNAGHNATLRILLGGKPVLALPISGEQYLVAQNLERLRAGICVPPNQPKNAVRALNQLLAEEQFANAAKQFAAKYHGDSHDWSGSKIAKRFEQIFML